MKELQIKISQEPAVIRCNFEDVKAQLSAKMAEYQGAVFTPFHFKKGGLFLRQGPPCPFYTPSAARFSSIRASIASPSLSMSFSTV
mgnify:CR=1 FL=1